MDPADPDDVAAAGDGDVVGTVTLPDGSDLPVTLDQDLIDKAEAAGIDPSTVADAATPDRGTVDLTAQTDADGTATVPVKDYRRTDLTSRLKRQREYQFINDDQIRRLIRNSVNYTERVGEFLLTEDDLIPTVKERLKALIVGEDGITPEPADPDADADQRLVDHLEDVYADEVRPTEVIDRILTENLMNARAVLRSTDLKELDLATLDYLRDGVTGEEIYVQDRTTVYTFDVDEDDTDGDADAGVIPDIDLERETVDAQPLVIGDHVFDVSLYDRPPLEAVADTAVNKMVLQRLKARKAEITSFGAVYASIEPPTYLDEDEYFDRVNPDNYDGDQDPPPTKLERALQNNLQSAFDTLQDFQSGTVMSVPDFWNLQQLEIPETGDPIDDQIRGYNRDISRRLLIPLDLIELQSGSELSRDTMFSTLMTTIAGWRREIKRVFDNFAAVHADIEGIDGEVNHQFPPLKDSNTKQIVSALQYAGVAGLSQQEVRKMLNTVQGIDLDTDTDSGGGPDGSTPQPPEGGPDDPDQRTDEMREMLQEQRRGDGPDSGQDPPATAASDVDLSIPDAVQNAAQAALDAREDPDTTVNGMTEVGWGTAETLADGGTLSESKVVGSTDSMANWWARHMDETLDTGGDRITVASDDEDNPWSDNSYTAGKGWGGVAGARFAFRSAAEITDDDKWRDHLSTVEASAAAHAAPGGGQGNARPGGDAGQQRPLTGAHNDSRHDQDGSGGSKGPSARAANILRSVPFIQDPGGDEPVRVSENSLKDWLAWVESGRPALEGAWNPALHPRGPDGQFVERPYDIPDDVVDRIDDMDTSDVLDSLADAGELSDGDLNTLLEDDGVRIDGIPSDVSTREELADLPREGDDGPDGSTPSDGADEPPEWATDADFRHASPGDYPDLRPERAESVEPLLSSDEGESGAAASNMDVADFATGETAFVKRHREDIDGPRSNGEKPTLAERAIAADQFMRNLGRGDQVPDIAINDPEGGYMSSRKVEGEHLRGSTPAGADNIDADDYRRFSAAVLLAGNSDLHGDNLVVKEDGSFSAIDLNKSGGDFTTPGKFRNRGVTELVTNASSLGIDMSKADLQAEAEQLAQELDPDEVLEGVPNSDLSDAAHHQFRENIRANIEAFANGEVQL